MEAIEGSSRAVLCETRALGIKWPHWHTLTFEGDRKIDMRYVFPKDVKKMLLQQARSVYWKKWAAKHEFEELKDGIWLEPALALLRKKTKPEAFRKWEQKAGTSKKEWKWRRGIVKHPLSESQWNRGLFSIKKWESEKHKSWGMPAEGFKRHVATDGSLLGLTGKW